MPDPEQITDMTFPIAGIDLFTEFEQQRPDTTPLGMNVRGWEALTQRNRGGSRNGISKWVDTPVVDPSLIQDLNTVVTVAAEALLTAYGPSLTGTITLGGAIENPQFPQFWVPVYGSGVQLNAFTGVQTPPGQGVAGNTISSGSGPFLATLIGGSIVQVTPLGASNMFGAPAGFLAVNVKGTYYFVPPVIFP